MQSDKRRKLREDLNRREKEVVTEKREEDTARSRLQAELQRLRRKMEEEQVAAAVRARQATEAVIAASKGQATPGQSQPDEATQSQLGRTLKVVWDASIRDYQPEELRQIFAAHGVVEDVVVRSSKKKRQVSALVVMVSKEAAEAAIGSVNGDHAAPLLVMPLLKVAPPEQVGPIGSSSPPSAGTSHRNTDPYVAAPPHSSSSQGLSNFSRSFPIPSQTMSSSSASSFPIPTPGTSANGTAAPPPGGNSAARVFSSFPGASSFQPPPGSGIGSGAAAPGGLGGVEGAILEKMKRAAERERMLREAAKEAEAEGS
ncbi:hypothetical protein DUNSADRAFT_4256 [Dunaliella salina]|uniref:RRM domain-containing protein n=1 Tax=Dunaliella salina TaxID=3046 RepID=A0ABQ7GSD2_DUNSA|nr:hypothetical protein DUNSADRAFT_4256 [Dunaliella salina]|eukprot:KAF5837509.1 hypothetical protein DUNSADRAFT_4256 [Dunaliella salina]